MTRLSAFYVLAVVMTGSITLAARAKLCPRAKWQCGSDECVKLSGRCDGVAKCGDGSDEQNCEDWICPSDRWKCSNHRCIKLKERCNGVDDCGDNSDEQNCGNLRIDCPTYVMEKSNLTCICRTKTLTKPYKISWPGHTRSRILTLTNIDRSANGTQYTCLLEANGTREEAVYTLLVAYGPHEGKVKITPPHVVSTASLPVTLTCTAEDTYPTPYYQWDGVACQQPVFNNTCTFVPDPIADLRGRDVICRAESVTFFTGQELHPTALGTATVKQRVNFTLTPNCGEDFTANTSIQRFSTPRVSGVRGYPNNQYCAWHIAAPNGSLLWFDFGYINLDCYRGGDDAYVYDGDEKTGRMLGNLCQRSWKPLMTDSGLMTVTFRSDYRRSKSGFTGEFKIVTGCGGDVEVDRGSTHIIQSPDYPSDYLDNLKCEWRVTAPPGYYLKLSYLDFDLQMSWRRGCRWDAVRIYEAGGRWARSYCGSMDNRRKSKFSPYTSLSNNVTIVFITSYSWSGRGFKMEIKATRKLTLDCPEYVMENSNVTCRCRSKKDGNITWPGHSQTSVITLNNVQRSDNGTQFTCLLKDDKGYTERAVYTLRVAYGPSAGDVSISPSPLVTNGSNPVTLTCRAANTYPEPDFEWEGVECKERKGGNTCTFYPNESLQGRRVTCTAVSAALAEDSQQLGDSDSDSDSDSGSGSDSVVGGTASGSLRLNMTFVPNCGEDLVASTTLRSFSSPRPHGHYPNNLYCVWHVTAPKGTLLWMGFAGMSIDRVNRRCRNDYVTVYDGDLNSDKKFGGKFCERWWMPPRLMTRSGLLTVKFTTDHKRTDKGFTAIFKTVPTCGGDVEIDRDWQTIQSPNYPANYDRNIICEWHLTAKPGFRIKFVIDDFNVQRSWRGNCRWGSVSFTDGNKSKLGRGTYCGDKSRLRNSKFAPFKSVTNNATIVFKTTHSQRTYKGFSLRVKATR